MDEPLNKLAGYLSDRLGAKLIDAKVALGELTIEISRGDLLEAIALLRDDALCHFGCLIDICGADYPDREQRFDVVYHLLSPWLESPHPRAHQDRRGAPCTEPCGSFPGRRLV